MLNDHEFPPLPPQAQRKTIPPAKRSCRREASHPATKRQRVTSLSDLPDELLVEILDYLSGRDFYHFQHLTLANLSLTNRRLHYIVSDRLYAAYDSSLWAPYPFLRTIISNPTLASHVESLSFDYGPNDYGPNVHADRPVYAPSIFDKQLIKDGLKRLNVPDWKLWASNCNEISYEQEHLYATILMCAPNVTSLEIEDGSLTSYKPPKWLKIIRQIVNGHAFGNVHRLEHLQSIRIDLQYLKLRHLAPIFRLRSMRKVTLIGLVEWANTEEDRPESLRRLLPTRTSFIEELQMEESFVHSDVLDVLLSSIRKLRIFRYWSTNYRFTINGHDSADYWGISAASGFLRYNEDDAVNNYHSIVKSLGCHQLSLETLYFYEDGSINSILRFTDTLRSFEKLAEVHVHLVMLTGYNSLVENLPPSVQSLTAKIGHEKHYRDLLRYMALNYHQHTPSLRTVKLIHRGLAVHSESDWIELQKLFADQGVCFEMEFNIQRAWSPTASSDPDEDSDTTTSDEESLYSN